MNRLFLEKAKFDLIKTNDDFLAVILLGRIINAIQCCYRCLLPTIPGGSNFVNGRFNNAFFFLCSVLYEGGKWAKKFEPVFEISNAWKSGFQKFFSNKINRDFLEFELKEIREKLVLYFDIESIKSVIDNFKTEQEINFIESPTKSTDHMFFSLSDLLGNPFFLPKSGTKKMENEGNQFPLDKITREFLECSWILIREIKEKYGFVESTA